MANWPNAGNLFHDRCVDIYYGVSYTRKNIPLLPLTEMILDGEMYET
jgi:hypothetical protein